VVDGKGRSLRFLITGRNVIDRTTAEEVLQTPGPPIVVTADKGYYSEKVRQAIWDDGGTPVNPSRANAKKKAWCPKAIYRRRHELENFLCGVKDWRLIATRYDKLARNVPAAVSMVGALCWVRF
jgi:transposase